MYKTLQTRLSNSPQMVMGDWRWCMRSSGFLQYHIFIHLSRKFHDQKGKKCDLAIPRSVQSVRQSAQNTILATPRLLHRLESVRVKSAVEIAIFGTFSNHVLARCAIGLYLSWGKKYRRRRYFHTSNLVLSVSIYVCLSTVSVSLDTFWKYLPQSLCAVYVIQFVEHCWWLYCMFWWLVDWIETTSPKFRKLFFRQTGWPNISNITCTCLEPNAHPASIKWPGSKHNFSTRRFG